MNAPSTGHVIDITDGWTFDEVKTIADCDRAEICLTVAIAEIEAQLATDKAAGGARGADWLARTIKARRYRKLALQKVQHRRGEINRAARAQAGEDHDRLLLNILRSEAPDQFQAAAAKVNAMKKGA